MSAPSTNCVVGSLASLLFACTSLSYAAPIGFISQAQQQLFKLDANGSRLGENAIEWSCVEDSTTGLFWQKHDPSRPLHNHASFTWYQPQQETSGSQLAYPTTSPLNVTCNGYSHDDPASYCNTDAYAKRVNQAQYCGFSDWRLPSAEELVTLASPIKAKALHEAAIDLDYFPFYDRFVYWTSSVDENNKVLTVASETKVLANALRSDQLPVRLVRGTQY